MSPSTSCLLYLSHLYWWIWVKCGGCYMQLVAFWQQSSFVQVCSSYPKVRMRKKGSIKQLESITIKIGGHKMDALFFLGVVTVLFGIVFAVLLSPKGQKWVNKYS